MACYLSATLHCMHKRSNFELVVTVVSVCVSHKRSLLASRQTIRERRKEKEKKKSTPLGVLASASAINVPPVS